MNGFISSETNRYNPRGTEAGRVGRQFGLRYPSPFFDVASQFLPENMTQLLQWCRYYFLTNPIINVAVSKLAEYPVTPLVFESPDETMRQNYKTLESTLRLRSFQIGIGLDYFAYGNAFASVYTPFERWLKCRGCGRRHLARENRSRYTWKNFEFLLRCSKCSHHGAADVVDTAIRSVRDIKLVRWNPENISVRYNEATGKSRYYYRIPKSIRNDVTLGDLDTIEALPMDFIRAVQEKQQLLFHPDGMYHLKREGLAQADQGWGTPLIYPLLKDAFYLQIMKKAQEALLMEHVVPMRVMFPSNQGMPEGIFDNLNLGTWRSRIETEVNMWRRDPNYIPILPIPLGFQQMGGDARALILHQEFRLHSEQMLAGAGIPVEFVFGGLQWSGTNTSLRALENMFLGYNKQREELVVDFVLGKIADFMGWPRIKAKFDRFKMADDLQRAMFMFQLNQANKISDRKLHEELGTDFDVETRRIKDELGQQLEAQRRSQVAAADIQGEASLHTGRYQARAAAIQQRVQMETQMEMQALQQQQAGGQPPQQQEAPAGPENNPQAPSPDEGATTEPKARPSEIPVALSGMTSPLQQGAGGMDLLMVAKKAAAYMRQVREAAGEQSMYQELQRLQLQDANLYKIVVQLLNDSGSKEKPLDGASNPRPAGTSQKDVSRTTG